MSDKQIFLSHIHEERTLALVVKQHLEAEFSGFVDVFVSSDGVTIPAGSNFLKRIEDGLVKCIAAIYLISPCSVARNWINFELGAVWIRNIISLRSEAPEIPTIPFCHSGIRPSQLPSPLNNLNGISGNEASQLEFAFRSIQAAVGGKGALKTDFDALASLVRAFEVEYTLGGSVAKLLKLLGGDRSSVVSHCEKAPKGSKTSIECGFRQNEVIQEVITMKESSLNGYFEVKIESPGISFGATGAVNGAKLTIEVPVDLITQFKSKLLA